MGQDGEVAGLHSGGVTSIRGKGVVPTARRVAAFLSDVPKVGLREALLSAGITQIDEAATDEILFALVDVLCGPGTLIEDTELKDAVAQVLEDSWENSESLDDLEVSLNQTASGLESVIESVIECYILEKFKTTLSEHLAKRFTFDAADKIADGAQRFVATELELVKFDQVDLTTVDWAGKEGADIVNGILERTVAVYLNPDQIEDGR